MWVETSYDGEEARIDAVHAMTLDGSEVVSRETFEGAEDFLARFTVVYTWDMDLVGPCIVWDYAMRGVQWSMSPEPSDDELSGLYTGDGRFFSLKLPVCNGGVQVRAVETRLPLDFDALAETFYPQWVTDLALGVPAPRVYMSILAAAISFDGIFESWAMTQASAAFSQLKAMLGPAYADLYPKPSRISSDRLRAAYAPGLCDLGPAVPPFVETSGGAAWDVNSLYPSIMAHERLPIGRPWHHEGAPEDPEGLWIAQVTVSGAVREGSIPCLFTMTDETRTVRSDLDCTTFWLTSVDYGLMCECYDVGVLCWHQCYEFASSIGDLAPYVLPLYDLKSHADPAMRIVVKQQLNTVYGKFGSRTMVSSQALRIPKVVADDETGEVTVGKLEPVRVATRWVPSTYPALAAFVTAYGRARLARVCNANLDRLLYYDTDSVILTGDAPPAGAVVGDGLGQWSRRETFERAKFIGPKQYYLKAVDGPDVAHFSGLSGEMLPYVRYEEVREGAELENRVCRMVPGGAAYLTETYTLKDWSHLHSV